MSLKRLTNVFKETFKDFGEDRVLRLSAAMAYYAIFSIGPLLVLIVGLAGLVLGEETVRKDVTAQIQGMVGEKSAALVNSMMTSQKHGTTIVATIVGAVGLILGAGGVFGQLQDALNTIWEVKAKPGIGIMGFLRQRFLSLTMILGIGFLLLVSLVLSAFVSASAGYIGDLVHLPPWVAQVFNALASFLVISLLFALIFKVLPDVKIAWKDVWLGALGTSLLFTAGKFALGYYLGRESTTSAYGAGSAFVVILLYIYYSSVILFFGAEFTQAYARLRGAKVVPTKYAVPVKDCERENQGMPSEHGGSSKKSGMPPSVESGRDPAPRYAHESMEKELTHQHSVVAPGEQIKAQPWSFVTLALAMGMTAGALLKFKSFRKALKLYGTVRRVAKP